MKFWDSSAILPLLVQEPSSNFAKSILKKDSNMVVWWGSVVEVTSALSRLEREGKLNGKDMTSSLTRLRLLRESWSEIQASEDILNTAQRLLLVHPLRAADSLQLAALIVACNHRPSTMEFICLGKRLIQAAKKEGCIVEFQIS